MVWLRVLGAAQPGFYDGEAGLHEHNQEASDQRPDEIDRDAILPRLVHHIYKGERLGGIRADYIVRRPCLGSARIASGLIVGAGTAHRQGCVHREWRWRGGSGRGAGRSGLTLGPCR